MAIVSVAQTAHGRFALIVCATLHSLSGHWGTLSTNAISGAISRRSSRLARRWDDAVSFVPVATIGIALNDGDGGGEAGIY